MLRSLSRAMLTAAVAGLALVATASSAHAQGAAKTMKDAKAATAKGAMPFTEKSDADLNKAATPPAVFKGANKGKAAAGAKGAADFVFTYDNYTRYYLKCFYGGQLAGTVAPYASLSVYVSPGQAAFACYAPGTSYVWGPTTDIVSGDYTWNLRE